MKERKMMSSIREDCNSLRNEVENIKEDLVLSAKKQQNRMLFNFIFLVLREVDDLKR